MSDGAPPAEFSGSIPDVYDRLLVPILFESYAEDMAHRVRAAGAFSVLEVAAGSGAVTRVLADATDAAITATDLSHSMIDRAQAVGTSRPVRWAQADAMSLPIEDGTFDAVVSQFGVMFVPDKARGFSEMRRVLRPGGTLIVSVWDRLEANGLSNAVQDALEASFPDDPPRFLPDSAFGYYDEAAIRTHLAAGGFVEDVTIEPVERIASAATAEAVAMAMCHGGPVRTEVENRGTATLSEVTAAAAANIAARFGAVEPKGPMRALVITTSV